MSDGHTLHCSCADEDARLLRNLRALAWFAQPHRLPPWTHRRTRRILALHATRLARARIPAQRTVELWPRPSPAASALREAAARNNRGGRA